MSENLQQTCNQVATSCNKLQQVATDTISRQAAIDALNTVYNEWQTQEACSALEEATSMIEGLPSAQPEIIRCKDCIYRDGSVCTNNNTYPWSDDDFCSLAERKEE